MKFSLIVATVGRADELGRFVDALGDQPGAELELIVVDQNSDDRVGRVLAGRGEVPTTVLRSARGLSRARNVGLAAATGDVVAFPDDDCWYPPGMLDRVREAFEATGADGVTITAHDPDGTPCGAAHWDAAPGPVERANVWRRGVSIGIFLRRELCQAVGGFDEALGAGAGTGLGAGEETDYLLRALAAGFKLRFEPSISALHPAYRGHTRADAAKAQEYGRGIGFVVRRHRYSVWYAMHGWLRSFGGMSLALLRLDFDRARFYRSALVGKIQGWLAGGRA